MLFAEEFDERGLRMCTVLLFTVVFGEEKRFLDGEGLPAELALFGALEVEDGRGDPSEFKLCSTKWR